MTVPHSVFLVLVSRGHWKGRDCANGQCRDGDTWKGQTRCGSHRYLPGKVNTLELQFLKYTFNLLLLTGSSSFSSLPKEVCSVILDAQCLRPIHTICNMVEPSEECQLVLRHFFNDSGIYCINVSMANDVSLAATSAKVNVDMGTQQTTMQQYTSLVVLFNNRPSLNTNSVIFVLFFVSGSDLSSSGTIAMMLGVLALVLAVGIVAYSYK